MNTLAVMCIALTSTNPSRTPLLTDGMLDLRRDVHESRVGSCTWNHNSSRYAFHLLKPLYKPRKRWNQHQARIGTLTSIPVNTPAPARKSNRAGF
jgi:hypothetical protein